jgi:uncharacterized protein YggT (Ycf19 family)
MDINLIIKIVFKVFYLLLVIRLFINFKSKSYRVINLKENIFVKSIKAITSPFLKPFKGIFKFNFDVSPIIVILIAVYFIEPLTKHLVRILLSYYNFNVFHF